MQITPNNAKRLLEGYHHVIETAEDFFKCWEGEDPDETHITYIDSSDITCHYVVYSSDSYQYSNREFVKTFPARYLYTPGWYEIEEDKKFKENIKAIEAHKARIAKSTTDKEQKDRELYLQLHKRFGDDKNV